jgi:hypothetical protein
MRRLLAAALLFPLSIACFADGPGTRIRAGSGAPPQPTTPAAERDLQRCAAMRDAEEKVRCMKSVRAAAAAEEKRRGPEATGAASGGSASGSFAPR